MSARTLGLSKLGLVMCSCLGVLSGCCFGIFKVGVLRAIFRTDLSVKSLNILFRISASGLKVSKPFGTLYSQGNRSLRFGDSLLRLGGLVLWVWSQFMRSLTNCVPVWQAEGF